MTPPNETDVPADIAAPAEPPAQAREPSHAKVLCANCGTPLLGDVCYACGQPVKGLVRHLGSILHDVADTIFNIDSRIFRTLLPLYFRPGYLTNEYFAGRRVRFVTPFRLYFFLSVAAFLLMQWGLDSLDFMNNVHVGGVDNSEISTAKTPEDVISQRDKLIAGLEEAKEAPLTGKSARKGIEKAEEKVRTQADKRLDYFKRVAEATAKGEPVPPDKAEESHHTNLTFNGRVWDPEKNPIQIDWLPGFANAKFNAIAGHMSDNIPRIEKDPKPFIIGAIGSTPQVLFFLMPLFALMLKIFYIFKRRLYMEHLIVALHSHSFIFTSLLLLTVCEMLSSWARAPMPWLSSILGWLMFLMAWWIPIYLLIMQKKVYRQGWFFTFVKYSIIGICYTVLISLGAGAAFLVSLATT
jgi:Protein of unknown function (DUF3667)